MEILLERIKKFCRSRSITVSQLEDVLKLPSNTIYQWKKRVPNTERLQLVADYFHTSIDYLLGRTDNPNLPGENTVTEEDLDRVLEGVMSFDGKPLTEEDREAVRAFMQGRKSK